MIEKIKERDIWEYLKEQNLPVILYGMGDGADKIISVLEKYGIEFADIFASDGFVRGHYFHNKPVLTFAEIEAKYEDFIVLITFAVHDEPTINRFKEISLRHEIYAPTVPLFDTELFTKEYIKKHDSEFDFAYSLLADERSKEVFVDILNFKVSGKLSFLFRATDEKSRVYSEILHLSEDEDIVDLGAYDGDTIREFLAETNGKYSSVTAFEPDPKNYKKLVKKTDKMERLRLYNLGAWDSKTVKYFRKKSGRNSSVGEDGVPVEFDSVDNIVSGRVSFLKMDIEGAEKYALEGARKTIETNHPKLYVCAYHKNEDFFELPKKITDICPDYKLYLRQSPYVPSWECNFYGI